MGARPDRWLDRDRQQRGGRRRLPALHRPGVGPGLSRRADHRPHQRPRAGRADRARDGPHPGRHGAAACPRHRPVARPRRCPATPDGSTIADRIATWDGRCTLDSFGCAAYMAWEYRVLRDIFDDDLGPLARDYVGSPWSWVALERLIGGSRSRRGGTTRPRRRSRPRSCHRAARHGRGRRRAAGRLRRPGPVGLGPAAHGDLQGGDDRDGQRDRAARVVLQRGTGGRAGRRRRRQQLVLPPEPRLPGPDRPGVRSRSAIDELFTVTNLPSYRLLDGPVRPRWGADRHHDRAVRASVRAATTTTRSSPGGTATPCRCPSPGTRSPRRPSRP